MRAILIACGALIALLALAGCSPSATQGGFDSPNPSARMYAIEQVARAGDKSAVKAIVDQLDSDDPAVRWLAITALQRLTGQTYGYRHYDPPMQRREAIARWVAAINSGQIMPMMNTPSPLAPAPQPAAAPPASSTSPVAEPASRSHPESAPGQPAGPSHG